MSEPVLRLAGIRREFLQGGRKLEVLKGVDCTLNKGAIVALVGPSGTGKSTLLHICGLLERPSSGKVEIDGKDCNQLSDYRRTVLRRLTAGYVYQSHCLLPDFSAIENVMLPQLLAGQGQLRARQKAKELLTRLGLQARLEHRPAKLSGGEQQRVAIARALANDPALLLADEPTGNLDPETAEQVFALLLEIVREKQMAALIATHNTELAARMDATFEMRHGKLEERVNAAADGH